MTTITDFCELTPSYIRAIAPYQPGKPISELERELGIKNIIKLASNENPLGVSPKALEAIRQNLDDLALYPDGNGFALKQALCQFYNSYNIDLNQIILGNGSNDVLEIIAKAFLHEGDEAIYSQHAFAVYPLATQAMGAKGVSVPAKNYGHDLDAMRKAITSKTKVIFIANPNNPTGTLILPSALLEFLKAVPNHVLVVLDEAYIEFLPSDVKADSTAWLSRFPNLILSRTFSKAYGLAGLRIGYGLACPEIIDILNRVRQPFNANSLALIGAEHALFDQEFLNKSYEINLLGMKQITSAFDALNIKYIPSFGNFVAFEVFDGTKVYQELLKRGVIVRPIGGYELPNFLRVSIGLKEQNQAFIDFLKEILSNHS